MKLKLKKLVHGHRIVSFVLHQSSGGLRLQKSVFFILILMITGVFSQEQTTKLKGLDIRSNLAYALLDFTELPLNNLDIEYVSGNKGVGISLTTYYDFNDVYVENLDIPQFPPHPDLMILPYYRFYFNYAEKDQAKGGFLEFHGLGTYQNYIFKREEGGKERKQVFGIGAGMTIGAKHFMYDKILIEYFLGGGLNTATLIHLRFGVSLGFRI